MKLTTCFFTFFGTLAAVSALPAGPLPVLQNGLQARSTLNELVEARFITDDDPIFARYFSETYEITEREYEDATMERRFGPAVAARVVIQAVKAVINLIKGQIEKDKKVCCLIDAVVSLIINGCQMNRCVGNGPRA